MTTQEFLDQLTDNAFSESTTQEVRSIIGDATEMTPELAVRVGECLEREIDSDLKGVEINPQIAEALEKEVSMELSTIDETSTKASETVEKNLQELADMSKTVDVLERLHTTAS